MVRCRWRCAADLLSNASHHCLWERAMEGASDWLCCCSCAALSSLMPCTSLTLTSEHRVGKPVQRHNLTCTTLPASIAAAQIRFQCLSSLISDTRKVQVCHLHCRLIFAIVDCQSEFLSFINTASGNLQRVLSLAAVMQCERNTRMSDSMG
ncbi:Hypothetical predicted protein [Podarcis lilfordi]|uniref:Uncharacterized protein n=1 Tax=Podarcis lilfordi TaxID=74358 RepID=A0AA35KUX3_9SAUR|nr:Hypothetical predicted protein [Podarcis lilfordi]